MHEEINNFLAGPYNHTTACDLYDKYGDNRRLMRIFRESDTHYNRESILHELKVLVRPARKAPTPPKPIETNNPAAQAVMVDINVFNTPAPTKPIEDPVLYEIEKERSGAYIARAKLSNQLLDAPDDAARAEIVKEINNLSADYVAAKKKQKAHESGESLETPTEVFDHKRAPKKVDLNQPKEVLLKQLLSQRAMRTKYRDLVAKLHQGENKDTAVKRLNIYEENCRAIEAAIKS